MSLIEETAKGWIILRPGKSTHAANRSFNLSWIGKCSLSRAVGGVGPFSGPELVDRVLMTMFFFVSDLLWRCFACLQPAVFFKSFWWPRTAQKTWSKDSLVLVQPETVCRSLCRFTAILGRSDFNGSFFLRAGVLALPRPSTCHVGCGQ